MPQIMTVAQAHSFSTSFQQIQVALNFNGRSIYCNGRTINRSA
jgi:hypothetical protein